MGLVVVALDELIAQVIREQQVQLAHSVMLHEQIARSFGLSLTDMQLLHLLLLRDNLRTPAEIARAAGMPPSSLTTMLDRLAAGGFITREHSTTDRRKIEIKLSPQAVERISQRYAESELARAMDDIADEFNDQELSVVIRYLRTLNRMFDPPDPEQ